MSMTAVAVAPDGSRLAVAWKDVRADSPRVWWSLSSEPKFAKDNAIVEGAKVDEDHPALALDASGTLHMAWEEGKGAGAKVRYRTSAKGGSPRDLSQASQGTPAFPVLALGSGFAVVAWETTGTGGDRVFAVRLASE